MPARLIANCPGCGGQLDPTRLSCRSCDIVVEGRFVCSSFDRLTDEQQQFVLTFLAARGNIKLVERQMGISYPTVRSRLLAVQQALGLADLAAGEEERPAVREVLDRLESGDLSVDEAIDSLD